MAGPHPRNYQTGAGEAFRFAGTMGAHTGMAAPIVGTSPTGAAPPAARALVAVCLGNGLAFYDLLIFSIMTVQISRAIFPPTDPGANVIATLGLFAAGLVTRPIGAVLIGRIGDRHGRKPAMLLAFGLAGIAVIGQALVPGHAEIGIWAPISMLVWRLLLGISIGGEVGPSTAYLLEVAPPGRRTLFVALQHVAQFAAVVLGGVVALALSLLLTPEALDLWGWRVALLIGAGIVPFGLIARRHLNETLAKPDQPSSGPTPRERIGARLLAIAFVLLGSTSALTYSFKYISVYAQTELGLSPAAAFESSIWSGLAGAAFAIAGGLAGDRFGHRPVALSGLAVLLCSIVPAFLLLRHAPSALTLALVCGWLIAAGACANASLLTALTAAMPMVRRSAGLGIVYALATSLAGGAAQPAQAWLLQATADPLSPGYFGSAMALIALAATFALPVSRRSRPHSLRNA